MIEGSEAAPLVSRLGETLRSVSGLYWPIAERFYRVWCANDVRRYPDPPDLFALRWVDPAAIDRHTRREYPPWRERHRRFGAVAGGDWDRRDCPPVDPTYDGPPAELFVADRFEESVLFRSLEARFVEETAWSATPLIARLRELLADGDHDHVWHGCRSMTDVRARCRVLDKLYETLDTAGVRPRRPVIARDPDRTFHDWLGSEITVDIGRDGELLLVCGKHRLAIAKLLDVRRVPVVVLVRHEGWMTHRRRAAAGRRRIDHPDLQDLAE